MVNSCFVMLTEMCMCEILNEEAPNSSFCKDIPFSAFTLMVGQGKTSTLQKPALVVPEAESSVFRDSAQPEETTQEN